MARPSDEDREPILTEEVVETKVYLKRWYILGVFSLLGTLQGMIWNSFGPISHSLLGVFCPHWSPATLALLGNWGNIMYILPIIPVMWFFEVKGLRMSMIATSGLMLAGTALRCFPAGWVLTFTVAAHACAVLNGVAGIVIFSAPAAVSSAWFPPDERTTATGIGIVFNNLGNAVSFLAAPAIVPDPPNATVDDRGCPEIEQAVKERIETRIGLLMILEASAVALCFAFIVGHFPSKPKLPPSRSSSMQRMDFLPSVWKIVTNRRALLMSLSFSLFNGLVASWYSVMNITFKRLPLGDPDDVDRTIGYIGLMAIAANSVATIFVSAMVDRIRERRKAVLASIMVLACCCWTWMCLLCLSKIPFGLDQLYASTILASALTYSAGPIFFELTVELVYPVPEGVVGAFLTCVYNSVGMIFLFLFYVPGIDSDPDWIPYAIMTSVWMSLPLVAVTKMENNRSALDQ